MDDTERNATDPASEKVCSSCYGRGKIRTGGCSLEHGISTLCEDFGCLPVRYETCPACDGEGYPNLKPA